MAHSLHTLSCKALVELIHSPNKYLLVKRKRKRKRNSSHQGKSTAKTLKNISSTKPILVVSIRFDVSTTKFDLKMKTRECRIREELEGRFGGGN